MSAFVIPLENISYLCWRTETGVPKYRAMSIAEDFKYFTTNNQDKFLEELINKESDE